MHPLRIVAADDDPDMIQFYKEAFAHLGHHAVVAENGRQLVDLCRSVRPDLVVSDVQMPEMDGIEAAKQVCQDQLIPFIFVSGQADADLAERLPACHVIAFLRKPVGLAQLERSVALLSR